MEIAFETKSLRDICETESLARQELGNEISEALKHRIADIRAAKSVKELIAGHPRVLPGFDGQFIAIDLTQESRLIISANHPDNPRTETDEIDWLKVYRIKINKIEGNDESIRDI